MNTITLAGTHYQTGFQWGSLLSARQHFILEHVPFPITRARRDYAAACRPVYARYYPELLEELRGLSDGQGCGEEELQAVLFSMYAIPPACACSCLAVAGGGETLFGRNSDFLVELEDYNTNVSCRFTDAGYAYTGSTTAFLEMEDGVNQRGLAAGLTSAWGVHIRPGFHVGLLLRWLLERCGTVEEALAAIRTLPLGSPFTLTLADAGGSVAVAEYDGMRLAVEQPRNPGVRFVCAVNAFHLPGMPSSPLGADNWQAGRRYATMRTALEGLDGPPTADFVKHLLSGRYGFLCQYDRSSGHDTVWSVACDLKRRRIFRSEGNPARLGYRAEERFPEGASASGWNRSAPFNQ